MSGGIGRTLAAAVALAVLAPACGSNGDQPDPATQGQAAAPWTNITPDQLAGMADDGSVLLVNVHVPYEGEIPGTDAFIPYDQVAEHLGELPRDTATKIVLYCRSGRMSIEAASTLAGLGYTNLYNLQGGYTGWQAAGYQLITG
jgi:rhodanese-related sulfurtransferase